MKNLHTHTHTLAAWSVALAGIFVSCSNETDELNVINPTFFISSDKTSK